MPTFREVFPKKKTIIGMIHLAGNSQSEKLSRAADELHIYWQCGLDGAIIEDYHGNGADLIETLKATQFHYPELKRGINYLGNPLQAFNFADKFGASFVQLDSVVGNKLDIGIYEETRHKNPHPIVFGGVQFKYQAPTGNTLETDILKARTRCEAIVTTGSGTGVETPLEKLHRFREIMGDYPLIVGAGITALNIREQLAVADGAIIGSYFKYNGKTESDIDVSRVSRLMDIVGAIR